MDILRQGIDGVPFREVAIIGGHLYQPVMQSFVAASWGRSSLVTAYDLPRKRTIRGPTPRGHPP